MPDSVLQQIADAFIAKSVAAGFVSTGFLTDVGRDWHDEPAASAAYLADAGERNEDGPTRSVSPKAGFFWHTIVAGSNATRLFYEKYKALKDGVDNDPTLGGLCHRARVTGYVSDKTVPAILARKHVAEIFAEAEYRHDRGAS